MILGLFLLVIMILLVIFGARSVRERLTLTPALSLMEREARPRASVNRVSFGRASSFPEGT
jgi:hypothetical protein